MNQNKNETITKLLQNSADQVLETLWTEFKAIDTYIVSNGITYSDLSNCIDRMSAIYTASCFVSNQFFSGRDERLQYMEDLLYDTEMDVNQ